AESTHQRVEPVLGVRHRGAVLNLPGRVEHAQVVRLGRPIDANEQANLLQRWGSPSDGNAWRVITDWRSRRVFPLPLCAPGGRRWQATLAAARWVGIHWPRAYGGRGAAPLQVAIFNTEYARARAPQPVNRVGVNLAGPTLLAHGTEEQKQRWLAPILTAEEIW